MNCFADEVLWDFLEGGSSDKDAVLKHIQHCDNCRKRLEKLKAEQSELRQAAGQVKLLDESFVGEVMNRITELDEKEHPVKENRKPAGRFRRWKWFGTVAAGLAVAVIVGAVASPTFASYLPLFRQFVQVQEQDMNKLYRKEDIKVTDKGLTVHVKQIVADSTQLMVFYQIEDSRGKVLPIYHHWIRYPYLVLDDGSGQPQVGGFRPGGYPGQDVDKATWAVLVFDLNKVKHKDRLVLKLDTKQVGSVKGSWKLNVPIDLSKLKGTLREVVIGKTLEAHGVRVTLKKIKYTPLGTFLELDRQISPQLRNQYEQTYGPKFARFALGDVDYGFRILDETGKVLVEKEAGIGGRFHMMDKYGAHIYEKLDNYLFQPFPHNKRLTFELTEVNRVESAPLTLTFDPRKLPAKVEDGQGNSLAVTFAAIKPKSFYIQNAPQKKVFAFYAKGHLKENDFPSHQMTMAVTVESGKRYWPLGGVGMKKRGTGVEMTGTFIVDEISQLPQKITLQPFWVKKYEGLSVETELPVNP
ncbi:hypothetical protein JIR001_27450 [Polycladomyces abyssicola]|uniref:DUF4179 domain-containing protein n=1 Tax=Polycladomyces abyssicola TaxID=1125966 RepID=A0A8D5UGH2_9BACL|nr:DUF4179 domain-containing protein [Polycladomyces abyssicola]BCU82962.1 hypothetical protein JIR001_27450 [Polycladomyces abyssicola]